MYYEEERPMNKAYIDGHLKDAGDMLSKALQEEQGATRLDLLYEALDILDWVTGEERNLS